MERQVGHTMQPQAEETLKVLIYWERKFQFSLKV